MVTRCKVSRVHLPVQLLCTWLGAGLSDVCQRLCCGFGNICRGFARPTEALHLVAVQVLRSLFWVYFGGSLVDIWCLFGGGMVEVLWLFGGDLVEVW